MAGPPLVIDDNFKEFFTNLLQESVTKLQKTIAETTINQELLAGKLQKLNKEIQGNQQTLQIPSYDFENSSRLQLKNDKVILRENKVKTDITCEDTKVARNMFDEMPRVKSFQQEGSVQEYYDLFKTWVQRMGLNELYVINMFISRLKPEIEKNVAWFKPKSLSDAYRLAQVQEKTNEVIKKRNNLLLLTSLNVKDLSKVDNQNNDLVLDKCGIEVSKSDEKVGTHFDLQMEPNRTMFGGNEKTDSLEIMQPMFCSFSSGMALQSSGKSSEVVNGSHSEVEGMTCCVFSAPIMPWKINEIESLSYDSLILEKMDEMDEGKPSGNGIMIKEDDNIELVILDKLVQTSGKGCAVEGKFEVGFDTQMAANLRVNNGNDIGEVREKTNVGLELFVLPPTVINDNKHKGLNVEISVEIGTEEKHKEYLE